MDLKLEDFTATFNVNITAAFYTAVAFLPLLKAGNEKRNLPQDSQFIVTVSGIESIGNDACHRVHPTDLQS
jgi:NAD(P)-dependent dehydrogenase (short-subunit alcohol dehydrogenase family)